MFDPVPWTASGSVAAPPGEAACTDHERLLVEFEAIIAANFPAGFGTPVRCPPRRRPGSTVDQGRSLDRHLPVLVARPRAGPGDVSRHIRARQRSPPADGAPPGPRDDRIRTGWDLDRAEVIDRTGRR